MAAWMVQTILYLPGFLSLRAKLKSLATSRERNRLTPSGRRVRYTSWKSPGREGQRQTILVSLGTVSASGAKKLSRTFTILGSGGALAACVIAAANAGTASAAQATAIFFLKVLSSRGAHTLVGLEARDVFTSAGAALAHDDRPR
jgi:hypothetical protein